MGRINSRAKGASFENLLAKMIREAFSLEKEDCYRTPLSGGHQAYSKEYPGDLLISDRLFERFPFVVEAKHRRTYTPSSFLDPNKEQRAWLAHLLVDLAKSPHGKAAYPLLVCRGQRTQIFCAMPLRALRDLELMMPPHYLGWPFEGTQWIQVYFEYILEQMGSQVIP